MERIWINEGIFLTSECTVKCEFGSFCRRNGSSTAERLIIGKTNDKELTEAFSDCGHYYGQIITEITRQAHSFRCGMNSVDF